MDLKNKTKVFKSNSPIYSVNGKYYPKQEYEQTQYAKISKSELIDLLMKQQSRGPKPVAGMKSVKQMGAEFEKATKVAPVPPSRYKFKILKIMNKSEEMELLKQQKRSIRSWLMITFP